MLLLENERQNMLWAARRESLDMRYNADSGDGEIRVSNVVNKTNSWKHNLTTNKITNAPASCSAPTGRFVSWLWRLAPALFSSSVSNITNDGDIQTGSHTCLVRTSLAPHQSLTISVSILKCKDQSSLSWMNQYVGCRVWVPLSEWWWCDKKRFVLRSTLLRVGF